jgi:DegV family protein with EDD domain
MTSIAIIVDAACDLPASFIQQNNVFILPFNIFTKSACLKDDALPETKLRLYKSLIHNKTIDFAKTDVLPSHEIEQFFFENIVFNFDSALFITVAASRSEMFQTMQSAWNTMSVKCFQERRIRDLSGNFNLHIVDSGTMGPGQGLLTYAAVAALNKTSDVNEVLRFLKAISSTIFTYGVASDLLYVYTRAKAKNEHSITWGKYALATSLGLKPVLRFHLGNSTTCGRGRGFDGALLKVIEHLKLKLEQGLRINLVNVSYSGKLEDIESSSIYLALVGYAKNCGVEVMLSLMSVTLAVNIGENAIMVAFATESSDFNA